MVKKRNKQTIYLIGVGKLFLSAPGVPFPNGNGRFVVCSSRKDAREIIALLKHRQKFAGKTMTVVPFERAD